MIDRDLEVTNYSHYFFYIRITGGDAGLKSILDEFEPINLLFFAVN